MFDFSNTSAPLPRIDATGFEPAVSASAPVGSKPRSTGPCEPSASRTQISTFQQKRPEHLNLFKRSGAPAKNRCDRI